MKSILFFSIIFCAIASPALAELTPQDLDKIRLIIHEENKSIKAEIASLKNDVSWIRGKLEGIDKQFESVNKQFESVDKQISHATNVTYGLIALIVAAVGISQIIMAWRGRSVEHKNGESKNSHRK